jgi:hypothetical protein
MPRKPWKPQNKETVSTEDKLSHLTIRLQYIAKQNEVDPACAFRADVKRLFVTVDLLEVHSSQYLFLYSKYPPLHETNETAVLGMLEHLLSVSVPRKPKIRPRNYNEDDRIFPANKREVVRDLSLRLASIILQERFGGYIREILNDLRDRDPWATSHFHAMSWNELDSILSSDDVNRSNEFSNILDTISSASGFEFTTIKRWIHLISNYPSPTSTLSMASQRFHDSDQETLDRLEGLYSPADLTICRIAHDSFRGMFPDRIPTKIDWTESDETDSEQL